jgi:hypothetical protein
MSHGGASLDSGSLVESVRNGLSKTILLKLSFQPVSARRRCR